MSILDWIILSVTITCIILYGIWKSRGTKNINGYLLADKELPWYQVGLSVMATQASAITFLSAPGLAYSDGMRFVQFYFGLPLAMIAVCAFFIPKFKSFNVYTAYEYLEGRFDVKTRTLTAALFLLQRGISTGIGIYAPAIILSSLLNIDVTITTLFSGILVILYTVFGGAKAVSYTQMFQMFIIFGGLSFAAVLIFRMLPDEMNLDKMLSISGTLGKMNVIETKFSWDDPYNLWSGIIGGFFLQLSYFGTDQSQVGRYLTGKSVRESRLGLILNGIIKIPMQFAILFIGILVFSFYQFNETPLFFNNVEVSKIENSSYKAEYKEIDAKYRSISQEKKAVVSKLITLDKETDRVAIAKNNQSLRALQKESEATREEAVQLMKKNDPKAVTNDTNYVFLNFVIHYLPQGVVGLLFAIILLASMGATASGINSLTSTTVIDFYKRFYKTDSSDKSYLRISRITTIAWGVFSIIVALFAGQLGNLIEAVNILGSLFYGTILGIFLVALMFRYVRGSAVFIGAVIAEVFVVITWYLELSAFLWLNVIGCALVIGFSFLSQFLMNARSR